ncbi:MAG: hypothetical protein ACRD8U_00920 [Pyrinomonadaceae bacterium]
MRYETLEDAGVLSVEVIGAPMDIYSFGVLQINLHDMANKVAVWLLSEEGLIEPTWKRSNTFHRSIPQPKRTLSRLISEKLRLAHCWRQLRSEWQLF